MIYLVFEDWHSDLDMGQDFKLFKNYDKAVEYFNDCIITNEDFLYCDNEDDKVINSYHNSFEAYEEGHYLDNHYKIELKEIEVVQ